MRKFGLREGAFLVRVARKTIEHHLLGRELKLEFPPWCGEKRGVFVTLETYPEGELRGCIGYVEPLKPLKEAILECAVGACHDPRFLPLDSSELNSVTVEVSVLTPLEKVEGKNQRARIEKIEEFKHGVLLSLGGRKAVFLPQVWEMLPRKEDFLTHLALKAGLAPESWKSEECEIYRFEVQAWKERRPNGEIEEVKLGGAKWKR